MRQRMDHVELVENAGVPGREPPADRVAARRSRLLRVARRWWPVPVVLAGALLAWQAVSDARSRELTEALRATPGVIGTTVSPPLDARAWGTADTAATVLSGLTAPVDGLVVVPAHPTPTRTQLVGLDPADGDEVWRLTLVDQAEAGQARAVSCPGAPGEDGTLWCTVGDTVLRDDGLVQRSVLVGVDPVAGALRVVRELPGGAVGTGAGDVLVVASVTDEGVVVEATDLASGAARWRTVVADAAAGEAVHALRVEGRWLVLGGIAGSWVLDPADGRVRAEGDAVVVAGERLVVSVGSSAVRLLGADGDGTAEVAGTLVAVTPDDRSGGDLLLLHRLDGAGPGLLRAVDPDTGEVVWERGRTSFGAGALVRLDGLLLGQDTTAVWALDAATGREVWRTEAGVIGVGVELRTDGRVLLRPERDTASGGGQVLVAYRLGDGRRLWETPYPDGVDRLWVEDGRLLGGGRAGVYAVD